MTPPVQLSSILNKNQLWAKRQHSIIEVYGKIEYLAMFDFSTWKKTSWQKMKKERKTENHYIQENALF